MRYFFHIGFVGENYNGWQKNGKANSVQRVIEDKLGQVLKLTIAINGCGRTDAKVNASQFFFHVDTDEVLNDTFLFRLNKILPNDISVFDIIAMDGLPHSRFDATKRQYDYFIHTIKNPFLSPFSSLYLGIDLDYDKLKTATALLTKYNNYRPFCTSPDKNEHTICHVDMARWLISKDGKRLRFQISANRFLSKMIRIIVGQLLKVGKGELKVNEFEDYLSELKTPTILSPAHPQGLFLSKVTYPYLDLKPVSGFFDHDIDAGIWEAL